MENKGTNMLEVFALTVVFGLFYFLSSGFESFSSFQPHPIYVIACLLAMRRGNFVGIVLAIWLSVMYTVFYLIEYQSLQGFFNGYQNALNISLAFLGAAIFGINFDRLKDENREYQEFLNETTQTLNRTANENVKLHRVYDDLRSQVINSENSILSLYEINKRFKTYNEEELYTELIGVMSKFLKTKNISIYTVTESEYLRLKLRLQTSDDRYSFNINEIPELKRVVQGEVLRKHETESEYFPDMSAPIKILDKVVAIANVDKLSFTSGNEYSFQLFKMIVEWFSSELDKIRRLPDVQLEFYHENTKVLKFSKFSEKLKQQEYRNIEYGLEYLYIQVPSELTVKQIDEHFVSKFREVDIISYDTEGKMIHILLPATPYSQKEVIESKIKKI